MFMWNPGFSLAWQKMPIFVYVTGLEQRCHRSKHACEARSECPSTLVALVYSSAVLRYAPHHKKLASPCPVLEMRSKL